MSRERESDPRSSHYPSSFKPTFLSRQWESNPYSIHYQWIVLPLNYVGIELRDPVHLSHSPWRNGKMVLGPMTCSDPVRLWRNWAISALKNFAKFFSVYAGNLRSDFQCWVRDLHSCSPFGHLIYSQVRLTAPPTQQDKSNEQLIRRFALTPKLLAVSCQ